MRTIIPICLLLAIAAGCDTNGFNAGRRGAPTSPAANASPGPTDTDAPAAQRDVMAYVNEQPIYMEQLTGILVANFGMPVARQLIADAVVEQAAAQQNITASPKDVAAESRRLIRQVAGDIDDPRQREQLLQRLLDQRGLSRQAFFRRRVLLRKLAERRVRIDEADLRDEFIRQYGGKVVIRHIQVESLARAQQIKQMLEDGQDFATLAQRFSTQPRTRANGGLIGPVGPKTNLPRPLIETAMSMKEPGQISHPVQAGTVFHILRLEEIIPPQDVAFEEVRPQLERLAHERQVKALSDSILDRLINTADISFTDPILQEQAQRRAQP